MPIGPGQAIAPPMQTEAQLKAQELSAANLNVQTAPPELVGYIKGQFEIFRNHRNTSAGWSNRMLEALRTYEGQYSPTKQQEVIKFGGSQIYARVSAQKCRAASSLLRDIYLGPDRPWGLDAPVDPPIPPEILATINTVVQQEPQLIAQQSQI